MNSEETVNLLAVNRVTNYTPRQKYLLYEKYGSGGIILKKQIHSKMRKLNGLV